MNYIYVIDDKLKLLKIINESELLHALKEYGNITFKEFIDNDKNETKIAIPFNLNTLSSIFIFDTEEKTIAKRAAQIYTVTLSSSLLNNRPS